MSKNKYNLIKKFDDDQEEIFWCFRYLFPKNKEDIQKKDYVKIMKKIWIFTKLDIENNSNSESNDKIIKRIKLQNKEFVCFCEKDNYKIKHTYDIVRTGPLRVYGVLKGNIFYLLEIDTNHSSR